MKEVKQITPPIIYKCSICFMLIRMESGWIEGSFYVGTDKEKLKQNIPKNKANPIIKYELGECCK